MRRSVGVKKYDGIERAGELLQISKERSLTEEELIELKKSHTGCGGLYHGANTEFFTPNVIVKFMTDMIAIPNRSKILEFSCGAGAFLNALYKKNPDIEVTGIELSSVLARIAALCYPKANIIQGNALDYLEQYRGTMDFVIGNPPFLSGSRKIPGFEIAKNSLEEFFLEMAVHCLKEGGEGILVMPDGILANKKAEKIRKWLMERCYYLATISLPVETFYFSGTSCKTSVIYFKKMYDCRDVGDYPILMAIANDIGWNSRGQMTGKCDLDEILRYYLEDVSKRQESFIHPLNEAI